jgi:hypothetical protein
MADDGWLAGGLVRFYAWNWLAFQFDVEYIMKNYRYHRSGRYLNVAYNATTNAFVDFPLIAQAHWAFFEHGDVRARVYGLGGGWLGVWASTIEMGGTSLALTTGSALYGQGRSVVSYRDSRPFTSADNRFDAGLICGLGLQLDYKAVSIFAEGRYNYSLTNLRNNSTERGSIPQYNNTVSVFGGVTINTGVFK